MKSSDPGRPSSRRAASGAWNRLKPVREDVLETYGLPSKGETRYSPLAPYVSTQWLTSIQAERLQNTRDLLQPHNRTLHETLRPQPRRTRPPLHRRQHPPSRHDHHDQVDDSAHRQFQTHVLLLLALPLQTRTTRSPSTTHHPPTPRLNLHKHTTQPHPPKGLHALHPRTLHRPRLPAQATRSHNRVLTHRRLRSARLHLRHPRQHPVPRLVLLPPVSAFPPRENPSRQPAFAIHPARSRRPIDPRPSMSAIRLLRRPSHETTVWI